MTLIAERFLANNLMKMHDLDPGDTNANAISWVSVALYRGYVVGLMRTIGTSAVTLTINAATSAAGAGSTIVKTKTFTAGQPDAVGDFVFLEATADEITEALPTATHVSAVVTLATGTDELAAVTIQTQPIFPQSGLSPDSIA